MALNGIPIDENQCIGDSLYTINEAFLELDDRTLNSGAALAALSTYVNAQSAEWANDIDNGVRALTGNWENFDNNVRALTGNWQGTYTTVKSVSSDWGTVKSVAAAVGTPLTVSNPTVNPVITVTTIPVSFGGTGQITTEAARNALLPNQTGNSGKFLRTNGTGFIYWDTTVDQNEATNLTSIASADAVGIYSSTGLDTAILGATYSYAGVMIAPDKFNLDEIRTTVVSNSAFWASNAGVTNLSNSATTTTVTVFSDTGTDTTIAAATPTSAGVMTAADKSKLNDAVTSVAPTNLSQTLDPNYVALNSSTGTGVTIYGASSSNAGVMTAADKNKLDGVASGAQVNVPTNLSNTTDTTTVTVYSSTGNNTILPAATNASAGVMTAAMAAKLDGLVTSTGGTVTDIYATSPLSIVNSTTTPTISLNTVGIDKGGTGQTTAAAAFNALAPSQTGRQNKFLRTDGNGAVSWEEPTTLATIKPIKEITTSTTANNDWSGAAIIAKNTSDITITLPQGTMQVGTEFSVIRTNAKVTFEVSTGALKVAPLDTYKSLAYTNSMAGALYIGNNTWHLYGDLLPYEVAT